MSALSLNFEKIDKHIRESLNNESSLAEAKELLKSWINSNRQMKRIKSIDRLLMLLKTKRLYNQDEFNMLKVFTKIIPDPVFDDLIEKHKQLLQKELPSPHNEYGERLHLDPL